jgi:hypothetical protein
VLGQARAKLLGAGRLAVDLEQTHTTRDPTQEAQRIPRRLARWIGLVPEIGVLGLGVDRVVHDGDTGGSERRLPELLGQVIEVIAHEHAESATRTRALRRVAAHGSVRDSGGSRGSCQHAPMPASAG